ncbi:MAG: hypothetical protein ACC647_06290 [Anaerolineales bacterium]|jgi:hypothetical protein
MDTADLIASFIASLLTIMVLSYLIGDNPFFKLAMHLLIGVAAGYVGAVAVHNVLIPGLVKPVLEAGLTGLADPQLIVTVIVPLILVLLLFLKVAPSTARYGTISMVLLVGVGAAVIVGGAITGSLIPLTLESMDSLNPTVINQLTGESGLERLLNVIIMLVGTIAALFYFRFTVRRGEGEAPLVVVAGASIPGPLTMLRGIGKGFIAVTFGVMYAGAVAATLIVLGERVQFIWDTVTGVIGSIG